MTARYDMSRSSYDQHVTVARWNRDAYDGVQMGDLITLVGGRAGIRWDTPWRGQRWEFSVIPEEQLPELIGNAEHVFADWAQQAAAEQYAEEGWLRAAENAGFYDDPRGD